MSLIIGLAIATVAFNILDSVTTEIGLRKFEGDLRGREGNPIMAWMMGEHPVLAEALKHVVVIGFVVWMVLDKDVFSLKVVCILLGLVVAQNTYIIIRKLITKKQTKSPIDRLRKLMHLPEFCFYPLAIMTLFGLSYLGAWLWQ